MGSHFRGVSPKGYDPADGGVLVKLDSGEQLMLESKVVLIATGSRPLHPPGIPFDDPDVHDSDTILELDRIPSSMVVIGPGRWVPSTPRSSPLSVSQ